MQEFTPVTQAELGRWMADNANGAGLTVCPAGGRTSLQFGFAAPTDVLVDLTELKRVVDYPSRDMTITVEAGLTVAELQSILTAEGQRLPIDVPQGARATIGGAIACNVSGPRRYGYGTFRDYLIGVSAVDAAGRMYKGGGRVVKNVAGYDLCKLLVGSRGTLGIMTQVTLKLKPIPEHAAWWWMTFESFAEMENVLERLQTSEARPVALEMLDVPAARLVAADSRLPVPTGVGVLAIMVEGTRREVEWQMEILRKEIVPFGIQDLTSVTGEDATRLTSALTEFSVPTDEPLTFQANLRPSECWKFAELATQLNIAVNCHAGNGVVVGQLPEGVSTVQQALEKLDPLRQLARSRSGNLVILHCDREWQSELPMCGDAEPAWPMMQKLKRQLDPRGLLNPRQFIDNPLAMKAV